jgi:hypothetical protein
VTAKAYGRECLLLVCSFLALWPSVLGLRVVRIVVIRDPRGETDDCYLLVTNVQLGLADIIHDYSLRWAIETMFKASKQIMDIQAPQHFCQESVEKVAPWVWALQTVITVWYVLAGRNALEAEEIRQHMGEWDTEWSLANMLRVLRRAILNQTIQANSGSEAELRALLEQFKNWIHLTS